MIRNLAPLVKSVTALGTKSLGLILLLSGCSSPSGSPALAVAAPAIEGPPDVVFLADNQYTEDHGLPIAAQTWWIDKWNPAARRPAVLNALSLATLDLVLEETRSVGVAIHLGDALNNGCASEWDAFKRVMNSRDLEWFLAPGNHDGYYLGISSPFRSTPSPGALDETSGWADLCLPLRNRDLGGKGLDEAGREKVVFSKHRFVYEYLHALRQRGVNWEEGVGEEQDGVECAREITGAQHLRRLCWYEGSSAEPWRAFILQEIVLRTTERGGLSVILMDTTAYETRPMISDDVLFGGVGVGGAGRHGQLVDIQRRLIGKWLAENVVSGWRTVLAGHHPYCDLSAVARDTLNEWASAGLFAHYFSAHTHSGFEQMRGDFQEINVGSLVDRPVEYLAVRAARGGEKDTLAFQRIFLTPARGSTPEYFTRCDREFGSIAERLAHRPTARGSDRKGWKSKVESLLTELAVYEILFRRATSLTPERAVCYRPYDEGCDTTGEGGCVGHGEVALACAARALPKHGSKHLIKIKGSEDVIRGIKKYRGKIAGKPLSEPDAIELARFLGAVRELELNVAANADDDYKHMRRCLALLASHHDA